MIPKQGEIWWIKGTHMPGSYVIVLDSMDDKVRFTRHDPRDQSNFECVNRLSTFLDRFERDLDGPTLS